MATSDVISWFKSTEEQGLIEDTVVEMIKLYGVDIYYLPREFVREDDIFGEDILTRFPNALRVEAYVENVEGFGGIGEFFSKFGVEIDDQITFMIARRRWEEIRRECILTEDGYPLYLESADNVNPGVPNHLKLEGGDGYDWSSRSRPYEGDLLFFPMVGRLFEITFVEHEQMFYPLGRLMTYQLKCNLWQPSSERIETGIDDIDQIAIDVSLDILDNELLLEDGSRLLQENGSSIIIEEQRIEDVVRTANNELIQGYSGNIVDFSERNPFVAGKRY